MSQLCRSTFLQAVALASALLSVAHFSYAQSSALQINRTPFAAMIETASTKLVVLHSHSDGAPHLLVADQESSQQIISATSSSAEVRVAVSNWFQSLASDGLLIPTSALMSSTEPIQTSRVWSTCFTMSYAGISVVDRFAKVVLGSESGKPLYVETNLPTAEPLVTTTSISESVAIEAAHQYIAKHLAVATPHVATTPKLVYIIGGEEATLRLAYETTIQAGSEPHLWRIRIDANTSEILDVKDVYDYFGGNDALLSSAQGTLTTLVHPLSPFDSVVTVPMPYETITVNGVITTTDSLGRWSVPNVTAPYTIVTRFSGPFHHDNRSDSINASQTVTTTEAPSTLAWTVQNSDAAERDAFYSVAIAHHYVRLRDTQLTELDKQFIVNVNLNQTCNAYYNPTDNSVNFFKAGGGCSNTGEIADVVYHEFGHGVTSARYQRSRSADIVDGSLGEGFADLNSAFTRDDPRIGIGFFNKGSLLRNCDNTKKWPKDLNADIHVSGEIIAGAFWDLRKLLGHDTAQSLFYAAEYLTPDGIGSMSPGAMQDAFVSVLMAVIAADDDDNNLANGTPHLNQIFTAFAKHNIGLSGLVSLSVDPIPDQDSLVASYPVKVHAAYTGKVGMLDAASIKLFYSIDDGLHYQTLSLQPTGSNNFEGAIQKLPAGSFVRYYASASTTFASAGTANAPVDAPQQTLTFMVGYRSVMLDDAEKDRGWTLGLPTDKATTGLWTRDIPYGTYTALPDFVQQDTDHSPNGKYCYLTGNVNFATKSRSIGLDDVDNGSTTLTTPILDLSKVSSPVIRYWYYYSNDAGSNPGVPAWTTFISNDAGLTWKPLQTTTTSTSGWVPYLVKVSEFVAPTAKVQLRFVATDNIGAIVEAGVDDLEILEGAAGEAAVVTASQVETGIGAIHPNPVTARGNVSIPVSVAQEGHATLVIKDILGRTVATPIDRYMTAGSYEIKYATSSLAAGTYWVQLTTPTGVNFTHFVMAR